MRQVGGKSFTNCFEPAGRRPLFETEEAFSAAVRLLAVYCSPGVCMQNG